MESQFEKMKDELGKSESRNKNLNLLYNEMEEDFTNLLEKKDKTE